MNEQALDYKMQGFAIGSKQWRNTIHVSSFCLRFPQKISYEKKDKKETELIIVIMTNPVFYLIHHKSNPHEKPSNQPLMKAPHDKPSSCTLTKPAPQQL